MKRNGSDKHSLGQINNNNNNTRSINTHARWKHEHTPAGRKITLENESIEEEHSLPEGRF